MLLKFVKIVKNSDADFVFKNKKAWLTTFILFFGENFG